jgi:hypothetical protein
MKVEQFLFNYKITPLNQMICFQTRGSFYKIMIFLSKYRQGLMDLYLQTDLGQN